MKPSEWIVKRASSNGKSNAQTEDYINAILAWLDSFSAINKMKED